MSQLHILICVQLISFSEAGAVKNKLVAVFPERKKRGPLSKDMSGDNFRTLLNRDGYVLIVCISQSKLPRTVCCRCSKDVSQENS